MTGLSPLGRISNLCCFPAIGLTSNSGNGLAKVSYSFGIGLVAKVGKTPSRCHLLVGWTQVFLFIPLRQT
jgi:hypothetical protein